MNKKLLLVVVVAIVVAVIAASGVVAYKIAKKVKSEVTSHVTQESKPQAPVVQANTPQSVQGTLKSLMASGKANSCTYTDQTNAMTITGKIMVSNGKMRGDFNSVNSDNKQSVNSHIVINDAQNMYMWTDLTTRGVKIALNTADAATASKSGTPNLDQQVQFSCQDWNVDPSVFATPSAVTFYSLGSPAAVCSACANLSAQAQQMCKQQLNCK